VGRLLGFLPDASSDQPWTEVDHPTNYKEGFGALRIHEGAEATRALEESHVIGRASGSGAMSSAVTPDQEHGGRGDQQPDDSLHRDHLAAPAPTRHRYEHATPSAHRPVPARPARECSREAEVDMVAGEDRPKTTTLRLRKISMP
jgi:hypothetical protein